MSHEDNHQADEIPKKDVLQLHWENYKMRQSHIWQSFNRLIFATVTLWAIPFIEPKLFNNRYIIFFLPIVALFLSFVGRKLIKAEYHRLIIIGLKIEELTPDKYNPDFKEGVKQNDKIIKIKRGQIGKIMLQQICGGLILLSLINLILIALILFETIPQPK